MHEPDEEPSDVHDFEGLLIPADRPQRHHFDTFEVSLRPPVHPPLQASDPPPRPHSNVRTEAAIVLCSAGIGMLCLVAAVVTLWRM